MKKTWAEKLEDKKNFPKIVRRGKRYQVSDFEKHLEKRMMD